MSNTKPPSKSTAVDTSGLYTELQKLHQLQDFDKALKVCNRILNAAPFDSVALHCKVVCLLQLGRFEEAVKVIGESKGQDFSYELSYCHYRLNDSTAALEVLESAPPALKTSLRYKELMAQILYRLERYQECYGVYRDIVKNTSASEDEFEAERMTNLAAVAVSLRNVSLKAPVQFPDGAEDGERGYEMVYNRACYQLACNEFAEAEETLKKAEQLCLEALQDEEEADEENAAGKETAYIRTQRAYAIQMLDDGREREAQNLYNAVLKEKPSDLDLIAVASNNLLTMNRDQNIFDSKKRIKAATADGVEHKLTSHQRNAIAKNNALLAMYTNQVDVCVGLVDPLLSSGVISGSDGRKIVAGVLSRCGKVKEAVTELNKDSDPKSKLETTLISAQVMLEKGQVREAAKLLDERLDQPTKMRAGVLSCLVALHLALEDRTKAAQLLKEAVASHKGSADKQDMKTVWRKTAEFHLKGDEPSVAAGSLEELLKMDPDNVQTLAQLVLAYARFDLKKALEVSRRLPRLHQQQDGGIDVDALEASSFVGGGSSAANRYGAKKQAATPGKKTTSDDAGSGDPADLAQKKRNKKKRKKVLPKSYDPNVHPDPERWLPRRERTGYRRPRKDRRKGEKFTGAQGASAGQQETYDYSQKKASTAVGAASPKVAGGSGHGAESLAALGPGPRQQMMRKAPPQQKKKKGKQKF